ncbi:hypothetical protein Pst134EB_027508 [Puccinia striiformis f. sp. tritici]|nr:hypothetical protein Pst134EB_027508 [Puccinia striiformis f. sp. tritici]
MSDRDYRSQGASCRLLQGWKDRESQVPLGEGPKTVKALSASFSYSSTLVIKKEIITKYSYEFIKVLRKFQSILTVISSHPKISASCTEVYAKFDYQFDSICTVFKKHGVEIYKLIHEEASLNVTIWVKSGFKFQSKGDYKPNTSTIGH